MRLRGLWQIVGSWLFIVPFGLGASALTIVTLGLFSRRLSPFLLRFWGRTMLKLAGVTFEVQGAEHLATGEMKIVPFNHGSLLDAFLVAAIVPRGGVATVKREILYYPVVGVTVYFLGFLFIDRGNRERALRTLSRAARRMARERLTVFIAPEGTRGLEGELLPFKRGTLHLALESRADIVPMLIDGAYQLHGPGRLISKPGHVVIRFLAPRSSAGLTAKTIGAETEALRALYLHELARLRADRRALARDRPPRRQRDRNEVTAPFAAPASLDTEM
jgi:lysophosphatidate acyltransferase